MSTYSELIAQAKSLQQQAEELRRAERAAVISEIKARMAEYKITLPMLKTAAQRSHKYVGPNGEKWAGGPGRRPAWVAALQARGEDIEQYRVTAC